MLLALNVSAFLWATVGPAGTVTVKQTHATSTATAEIVEVTTTSRPTEITDPVVAIPAAGTALAGGALVARARRPRAV